MIIKICALLAQFSAFLIYVWNVQHLWKSCKNHCKLPHWCSWMNVLLPRPWEKLTGTFIDLLVDHFFITMFNLFFHPEQWTTSKNCIQRLAIKAWICNLRQHIFISILTKIFAPYIVVNITLYILRLRPARLMSRLQPSPPSLNNICLSTAQGIDKFFGMAQWSVRDPKH